MGFKERRTAEKKMVSALTEFFTKLGFQIANIGYENVIHPQLREKLRFIYDDKTVLLVRFMPDKFVYLNGKNVFLLEFKICNTPIKLERRIRYLKEKTGISTLSSANIGAIETSTIENYKRLESIGVKIMLVIYSKFHGRPLVANWLTKVKIIYQDKVIFGQGNASRTPYSDVNLDDFVELREFMVKEFKFSPTEIEKPYSECLKKIRSTT